MARHQFTESRDAFPLPLVDSSVSIIDAAWDDERQQGFCLCKRNHPLHPYVTWSYDKYGGRHFGHYVATIEEAASGYADRTRSFTRTNFTRY